MTYMHYWIEAYRIFSKNEHHTVTYEHHIVSNEHHFVTNEHHIVTYSSKYWSSTYTCCESPSIQMQVMLSQNNMRKATNIQNKSQKDISHDWKKHSWL